MESSKSGTSLTKEQQEKKQQNIAANMTALRRIGEEILFDSLCAIWSDAQQGLNKEQEEQIRQFVSKESLTDFIEIFGGKSENSEDKTLLKDQINTLKEFLSAHNTELEATDIPADTKASIDPKVAEEKAQKASGEAMRNICIPLAAILDELSNKEVFQLQDFSLDIDTSKDALRKIITQQLTSKQTSTSSSSGKISDKDFDEWVKFHKEEAGKAKKRTEELIEEEKRNAGIGGRLKLGDEETALKCWGNDLDVNAILQALCWNKKHEKSTQGTVILEASGLQTVRDRVLEVVEENAKKNAKSINEKPRINSVLIPINIPRHWLLLKVTINAENQVSQATIWDSLSPASKYVPSETTLKDICNSLPAEYKHGGGIDINYVSAAVQKDAFQCMDFVVQEALKTYAKANKIDDEALSEPLRNLKNAATTTDDKLRPLSIAAIRHNDPTLNKRQAKAGPTEQEKAEEERKKAEESKSKSEPILDPQRKFDINTAPLVRPRSKNLPVEKQSGKGNPDPKATGFLVLRPRKRQTAGGGSGKNIEKKEQPGSGEEVVTEQGLTAKEEALFQQQLKNKNNEERKKQPKVTRVEGNLEKPVDTLSELDKKVLAAINSEHLVAWQKRPQCLRDSSSQPSSITYEKIDASVVATQNEESINGQSSAAVHSFKVNVKDESISTESPSKEVLLAMFRAFKALHPNEEMDIMQAGDVDENLKQLAEEAYREIFAEDTVTARREFPGFIEAEKQSSDDDEKRVSSPNRGPSG